MKRSVLILLLAAILLSACASGSQVSSKDYRLYEMILEGFQKFGYENFVIRQETNPDSQQMQPDALWNSLSVNLADLQKETVEGFISANASPATLKAKFEADYKVQLLDPAGLKAQVGDPILWDKFDSRFPACPGVLTFTRPGYNATGDQALVYYTLTTTGDVSTSYFYLFTRSEGKWQISASVQANLQ